MSNEVNNNENSGLTGFFKKIGVSTTNLVNNSVVEFLVERYVNWPTETQRRFKKVMGIFLMTTAVAVVVLVYLGTYNKHKEIESHQTMYQMLKKYVIKKEVFEKRLANLQAGRGDIIKDLNKSKVTQLLTRNDILEERVAVEASEPEKTAAFIKKNFSVKADNITYPQLVKVLYDVETLGTNLHISEVKVTQEGLEKGFYAMRFNLSVFEPIVSTETAP